MSFIGRKPDDDNSENAVVEKKRNMLTAVVANGYVQANNRNDGDGNNTGTVAVIGSVGPIRLVVIWIDSAPLKGDESRVRSQRRNALLLLDIDTQLCFQ